MAVFNIAVVRAVTTGEPAVWRPSWAWPPRRHRPGRACARSTTTERRHPVRRRAGRRGHRVRGGVGRADVLGEPQARVRPRPGLRDPRRGPQGDLQVDQLQRVEASQHPQRRRSPRVGTAVPSSVITTRPADGEMPTSELPTGRCCSSTPPSTPPTERRLCRGLATGCARSARILRFVDQNIARPTWLTTRRSGGRRGRPRAVGMSFGGCPCGGAH
jgi:hypothetical protein